MLQNAVYWAEDFTGKDLALSTVASYTEYFDGCDTDQIAVRNWPVVALTSVSLIDDGGTTTALDSTTYRIDLPSGVISLIGSTAALLVPSLSEASGAAVGTWPNFPRGRRNVKVIYTYGDASFAAISGRFKLAVYRATDRLMASVGKRDANPKRGDDADEAFFRSVFQPFRTERVA